MSQGKDVLSFGSLHDTLIKSIYPMPFYPTCHFMQYHFAQCQLIEWSSIFSFNYPVFGLESFMSSPTGCLNIAFYSPLFDCDSFISIPLGHLIIYRLNSRSANLCNREILC